MVHDVPEDNLCHGSKTLETDTDKISFIIDSVHLDVDIDDVVDLQRLGRRTENKHRPLRVTLANTEIKFAFLNSRKTISTNNDLRQVFHNKTLVWRAKSALCGSLNAESAKTLVQPCINSALFTNIHIQFHCVVKRKHRSTTTRQEQGCGLGLGLTDREDGLGLVLRAHRVHSPGEETYCPTPPLACHRRWAPIVQTL